MEVNNTELSFTLCLFLSSHFSFILTVMLEDVTTNIVVGMERIADQLGAWSSAHLLNIAVILVGAWIVRRFSVQLLSRLLHRTVRPDMYPTKSDREKRIKTLDSLIGAFMRAAVFIIAAILIVAELNPEYATALFASAGLVTVAVGFGAKDLINDFISGIFIITEHQYRVGDVVKISGVAGVVEAITVRTTVLRDLNGHVHHVPNGSIETTTNMTLDYGQINEDIVVGYGTDLDQVKHIIEHTGQEMASDPSIKSMIKNPPEVLRFDGFGENGVVVKIIARTTTGDQWTIKGELYERLYKAFDKHQIEIPFRHVVVHDSKNFKKK
jgi:moderate conductance mechanosensitive channel